jgi:hypothetical protein
MPQRLLRGLQARENTLFILFRLFRLVGLDGCNTSLRDADLVRNPHPPTNLYQERP